MRRAVLTVATGALILGGSLVVLAQSDDESATEAEQRGPLGHAIEEVLADLVADDTLTQDQADAVIEALEARRSELRQEVEAAHDQLEEFWEDDQLTPEEIDQLPQWHRWRGLSDLLEDGVITRDELGAMRGDGPLRRFVPRPLR